MNWVPLHGHSFDSLLDGLSKPFHIADRCAELGYSACAITDHGTVSGAIAFSKALQKKNIKPILGCEFYLSRLSPAIKDATNRSLSHLCVLAKNLKGWQQLVKATSAANLRDHYYYRPRLSLDALAEFCDGNLLSFSGHMGSDMANVIFDEPKLAYRAKTYEDAVKLVRKDWIVAATTLAERYRNIFGKENFWLEIQVIDGKNLPASIAVAKALRYISKQTGIPCVATADSHYAWKEQAADQRILLCSALNTTLKTVQVKLDAQEDVGLGGFFKSNNYHIPSVEELIAAGNTENELENSLSIASQCEEYSLLGPPMLPTFVCPNGKSSEEYLTELCREGWKNKLGKLTKESQGVYSDRVKHELGVIREAGLSAYFLIVQDYVKWAKSQGWLVGPARGSAGGSLIAYLSGITSIDPIPYGLLFERFYNSGRNSPGHVSLPDIDCDFPVEKREHVISYIREKYGKDCVSQISTFGRMQGRAALKDVLRAHEACSFDEMSRMTEHIPDEAEISDQLQVMKEDTGDASIIQWALENNSKQLSEWCHLDDKGNTQGPYANLFAQAIRLEGTKRSQGKHAAGIVIGATPLANVCPMVFDKNGEEPIAGMEMGDLEKMGFTKFDILGVAVLDKIMKVCQWSK